MTRNKEVRRMILAASLTALSILINVFFRFALNIPNFGLPFYAIPLVLGSIILGPVYGMAMGFVSDALSVPLTGGTYLPLFVVSKIMWGVVPALVVGKNYSHFKLAIAIPLAYILANLSNTLAMFVHFDRQTTLALLVLRMALIPFNSVIMFVFVKDIYLRLKPLHESYLLSSKPMKT